MTPPQRQAAPEALLSAQLVSLAARGLRFAYRAARTWWLSWDGFGRFGLACFTIGAALWLAVCPLWASPVAVNVFSILAATFCTWGALWAFGDAWWRAGRKPVPAPELASPHIPPGECP